MSALSSLSPISRATPLTTTTQTPTQRIWSFLTDMDLSAVPCVSHHFETFLSTFERQKLLEQAFKYQRIACQLLKLANNLQRNLETSPQPSNLYLTPQKGTSLPNGRTSRPQQSATVISGFPHSLAPVREATFDDPHFITSSYESALTTLGFVHLAALNSGSANPSVVDFINDSIYESEEGHEMPAPDSEASSPSSTQPFAAFPTEDSPPAADSDEDPLNESTDMSQEGSTAAVHICLFSLTDDKNSEITYI
jgi:hypothetical protein